VARAAFISVHDYKFPSALSPWPSPLILQLPCIEPRQLNLCGTQDASLRGPIFLCPASMHGAFEKHSLCSAVVAENKKILNR
jgi:hypothetical protein